MTSPSSWAREAECLASTVYMHTKSTGPRAVRGTSLHRFLCGHAKAKTDEERAEALEEVDADWRPAAAAIDWSRMPDLNPETGVPELAIAWSPSTGIVRELGRNGAVEHDDLEELLEGDEMGGIIDWCALTADAVFVTDWKFGYQRLERAEVNHQLRAYSLFAAKLFGREKAICSYARIFDDGGVSWDIATMDSLKLDAAESALRQHLKRVEAARLAYRNSGVIPVPKESGLCRYCPAQNSCHAKVALLQAFMADDPDKAQVLATLPEPLTQEAAARLWPQLQHASAIIKRLTGNVKDVVRIWGPLKLANGKILTEVEKPFESIEPEYARAPLKARFGEEAVEAIIKKEESLTKKALDGLLHDNSSHGKKAALKRDVMKELDDAGALRVVVKRAVEEVAPDSKKLKATEERRQLQAANAVPPEEPEAA